jgi:4a-hydroxytetrahydrobiopterin dehydratase
MAVVAVVAGGAPLLSSQTCAPCKAKGGSPAELDPDSVAQLLADELSPDWALVNDGGAISRTFTCRNFQAALAWVVAAGEIAEAQGHHPDLHITSYRQVQVVVYTHSIGGLCQNDFILAAHLDLVPTDYSPKFLKDHPTITAGRAVVD